MQYVNFGTTGLQISRLGFGGIPIQRIDQPGTRELLIAAHKAGINYIDTARAYTVSEAWIGQSLEEAGLRDDFILATKCRALTKADMEAEIATSLKNLRTDHIELFQFHNPSLDGLKTILAPGGAMEALLEAKARGIVGHIGITAHLAAVFEAALDIPEIETIMFPYNIVEQQGRELIDRCAAAGKGFIDMKPLAGGAIEDGRLALRYVLSNPAVTVSIPGMATVEELNGIKDSYDPRKLYEADPLLHRVLDTLIDGTFPDEDGMLKELHTALLDGASWHKPDQYFLFYDFDSYKKARLRVNHDYCDRIAFGRKCLMNVASAGKFSSDRTIRQYAEDIWHIQPVK